MSNNETQVSNARLGSIITGLKTRLSAGASGAPDMDRDLISALTELQTLRSTPVEAEPVAFIVQRPLKSGGMHFYLPFLRFGEEADRYREQNPHETLVALYAHPLPNPSPSDGEVSDVLRRARNYIDDMPHLFPENAHPNDRDTHRQLEAEREPLLLALTAAIQSKRGRP